MPQCSKKGRPMPKNQKPINLALQGGGAHGAFTWGVLDYLLEDGRLRIAGVSGTSAGAMNASAQHTPLQRTPMDRLTGNWGLENNPFYHFMNALTGVASPYQLNPMNINPLRDLVEESIDFEMVRKCTAFELFVSATNVETGRVKVFPREDLTADMVMASACLPHLYRAVEIDPIERKGVPRSAQEIENRLNEISFNASLLKELRAIDFVDRLIAQRKLSTDHYRPVKVHLIENEDALKPMGASSKMNVEWAFLTRLRDIGRETAATWLDNYHDRIGVDSTVDLRAMFQGIGAEHQG